MYNHSHVPHKLLEYVITKAAVSGKEKTVKTIIPFNELMAGIGQPSKNSDYDLEVTIALKWVPCHPLFDNTETSGDEV